MHIVAKILICSYLYYQMFESTPMSDYEYDQALKNLTEEDLKHPLASVITPEHMSCGSLFDIRKEDYHPVIVQAAEHYAKTGRFPIDIVV